MAIAPATTVKLYEGIPWSKDKLDFRYFGSYANRNKYFNETLTPKAVFNDFTYLRNEEGHPISVPIGVNGYNTQNGDVIPTTYAGIMRCNYVFYENPNYMQHWFGGFITDIVYKNDGCAWIYFEEDIYHNWFSNITIDSGFIERETVDDDTIGKHRLIEPVNMSEYMTVDATRILQMSKEFLSVVIFMTEEPPEYFRIGSIESSTILGENILTADLFNCCRPGIQGGFPQSKFICVCKFSTEFWLNTPFSKTGGERYSTKVADAVLGFIAKNPSITAVYLLPTAALSYTPGEWIHSAPDSRAFLLPSQNTEIYTKTISLPSLTKRYKNNKCLSSPFTKLLLCCGGVTQELSFENFMGEGKIDIEFVFELSETPSYSINLYQYNENYVPRSHSRLYGLTFDKFPQLNWTTDSFSQWISYNKGTIISTVSGAMVQAATLAVGAPELQTATRLAQKPEWMSKHAYFPRHRAETYHPNADEVKSYYNDAAQTIGNSVGSLATNALNAYCAPDNPKGSGANTNVTFLLGLYDPELYVRQIRPEYLASVDNYFSMFGYRVNRVGKPNLTSRKNWNYVKTQNAHCSGNAPQYAIEFMESALDTGCTFWHKDAVGDYGDLSNPIV